MHWIALQPESASMGAAAALTDPLTALGWWALRYTPKVARSNGVLLLEVSASARLWGGLAALLHHVLTSDKPVALYKYAQAATSLVALAQLDGMSPRALQPAPAKCLSVKGLPVNNLPVDDLPVDDLPLHALAAAQPHLDTLARLGVTTWGQLRALPRGGVSRRFGAPLLNALDQAYGVRPDLYPWLVLPEVFEATLELSAQVENAPALLFAARRLLAQLKVWLQLRQRGVLALELIWQMDERRHTERQGKLVWRTAQPTQDGSHLQRLLVEHLAHVSLPAPAHTLRLRTLETSSLPHASASLLPDAVSTGDSLAQMVERLSARLGSDRVLQLQPRLDHRPEHMQTWLEAATPSIATYAIDTRSRASKSFKNNHTIKTDPPTHWAQPLAPTWLLQAPLKLALRQQQPHYQGALTLLAGPQRLEAGWWGGGDLALRDYFVAHSAQAGLLWVYRQRLMGPGAKAESVSDWYLHGFFA